MAFSMSWRRCSVLRAGLPPLPACRFFQLVYRSTLVFGAEALCKDFCLVRSTLHCRLSLQRTSSEHVSGSCCTSGRRRRMASGT